MQPQSTQRATFKPRVRRLGEGRYLVESASRPGLGHPCTARSCNCPGFSYRGLCRHVTLVRAIEPAMRRWYGQATAPRVATTTAAPVADAAALAQLAQARRALADSDPRSDEYVGYLRAVDRAERAIAALEASACRAA